MSVNNDEPRYITRLMKMECDMGTVKNYINVDKDHGVLAGGNCDAQPVMNANDHTSKHVIHFGKCKSESNPERAFREMLVKALLGPAGAFLTGPMLDKLEELGILTYQCKPNTPQPWIDTNEDCIIEGAPALTMDSQLACRYGGRITFAPLENVDVNEQEPGNPEETAQPEDIVNEAFQAAVGDAMAEVSDLGEVGAESVEKVQAALALASAMPAQTGMSAQSGGNFNQNQAVVPNTMAGNGDFQGTSIPSNMLSSMESIDYNKPISKMEAFAYEDTMAGMDAFNFDELMSNPDVIDTDGMVIDQSAMENIRIYDSNVAMAGSAAVALYNTIKTLEPDTDMTFMQAVQQMESYGKIAHPVLGTVPLGIADALHKRGYKTQYCFETDTEIVSNEAVNADASIMMYATTKNTRCVAFRPDPVKPDAKERTFTFYNEAGKKKSSMPLKKFDSQLSDEGRTKLGAVTIAVEKPKKQIGNFECKNCIKRRD